MAHSTPGLAKMLDCYAAKQAERDYIFMSTPFMEVPTEETKRKAKDFADKLQREGKLFDYLKATCGIGL